MTDSPDGIDRRNEQALLSSSESLIRSYTRLEPNQWLLVDTADQRLILVREGVPVRHWTISTSDQGLDNRENSGGTPPGLHQVARKIGDGQTTGTVFKSRKPTGEIWAPQNEARDEDLILTRILVLDGLEEGLNRGPGIDSRERYIYLHGTNQEELLGQAVSHGCVRLSNRDVEEVFELVAEGDFLVIT